MKSKNTMNFRVGLFVLITVITLATFIFFLSGEQSYFEKSYRLETSFANTAGLLKGASVRLSGVRIGTVTDINFAEKPVEGNAINVTMKVNREGMQRLSPDAKATIRTEGLLGDKYIDVLQGKKQPLTALPDTLRIEAQNPMEFTSIIGRSGDLLTNVISISESLDKIVKAIGAGENLENINKTIASVRSSSETLQRTLEAIEDGDGLLHTMIYTPKDESGEKTDENVLVKLNKATTKLDNLLNNVNNGDGALHTLIYDKELKDEVNNTISNINEASGELRETLTNFREISEMLRGGEGTLGALLIDPSVYDSLKGVLGEAERSRFVRATVKLLVEKEKARQDDLK